MSFSKDFTWGVAAASYQIEGAAAEDDRGQSVWDMFCRRPGNVRNGHSGEVACDHYHRYREDIALMKEMGVQAYRLSVSWPRVLPEGIGAVNQKGLSFYDRLVDELLNARISPYITLFHWDYPYALFCRGGWLSPDSPNWFADYTQVVVDKLSDRVKRWFTLNEPQCFIGHGHQAGIHAPGMKYNLEELLITAHNTLLAHGKAAQVIRTRSKSPAKVGIAPVCVVAIPATGETRDIEAARNYMFSVREKEFFNNTWWMDPLIFGRYPEDGRMLFGKAVPRIPESDWKVIAQPLDFIGLNIYSAEKVKAGADGPEILPDPEGFPLAANKWQIYPEAAYWGPRFYWERYQLPLVISENGMSNMDWVSVDGQVHDPQRIDFITRYLGALRRAVNDGVKVRGYFHWSILDNFEWAEGYKERFGLIYVDYPSQKRIMKDSAYWYQKVIETNGDCLGIAGVGGG